MLREGRKRGGSEWVDFEIVNWWAAQLSYLYLYQSPWCRVDWARDSFWLWPRPQVEGKMMMTMAMTWIFDCWWAFATSLSQQKSPRFFFIKKFNDPIFQFSPFSGFVDLYTKPSPQSFRKTRHLTGLHVRMIRDCLDSGLSFWLVEPRLGGISLSPKFGFCG